MPQLKNSEEKYGVIAKLFHWVMALLILGMLAMGLQMVSLPIGPDKLWVYGIHKSTGIIILFLAFLRLSWRQVNYQPKIPEHKEFRPIIVKLMEFAAKTTHAMIYLLMFAMPLSGWAMSNAYGFPVSVYGWFVLPNLVSADPELAKKLKTLHDTGALLLIGLLVAHIGAALFHHFILKDIVMKRMLPWVILLVLVSGHAQAAQKFEVDKAKSSIKFEAVQNGAPTIGEFKTYNAQIEFSPTDLATSKANVDIDIASVSSTYAEMVSTLKGKEWFDIATFPTAKFVSTSFKKIDDKNFEALGKLTIRDKTNDVVLKFKLVEFDDKHAIIDGETVLKRTAYGLGWADTGTVKDDVKVMIHIEAKAN